MFPGSPWQFTKNTAATRCNELARSGLIFVFGQVNLGRTKPIIHFLWRATTSKELAALHSVGALHKNRVPVNLTAFSMIKTFVLSAKTSGNFIHRRNTQLFYEATCANTPGLKRGIEGMLNEVVFQAARLLKMPTVMKYKDRPEAFRRLALEVYSKQPPTRTKEMSSSAVAECLEFRKQTVMESHKFA